MEKEITINEKTYCIKEIKYKELTSMGDLSKEESAKKLMMLSAGITEEEYDNLSLQVGIKIQKVVNEINGLTDF